MARTRTTTNTTSERAFQQTVIELFALHGWETFSVPDSRRVTSSGFPDLTLMHPTKGWVVFAELKIDGGRFSKRQRIWLDGLMDAGQHVYEWFPRHWDIIERVAAKGPDR
jgi:VRR-NUC domain